MEKPLHSEDIVKEVLSRISTTKGVHQTLVLTDKDRRKILELEEEAEKKVMAGFGYRDNQGIKEALKRDVVIAFITDNDYVWPPGSNLILKWKDEVIGEEVTESQIKELKNNRNVVLVGKFALHKDKMPTASEMAKEPPTVLFPPKQPLHLKNLKGVSDTVQGSPCVQTDTYLKKRMDAKLDDVNLGTSMIGFNSEN
ncbi:MAG: hypothetical protein ACFFA1_07940 [Promethearchaeota archaeon]